eukprot:1814336-Rhodomonas_salina.1
MPQMCVCARAPCALQVCVVTVREVPLLKFVFENRFYGSRETETPGRCHALFLTLVHAPFQPPRVPTRNQLHLTAPVVLSVPDTWWFAFDHAVATDKHTDKEGCACLSSPPPLLLSSSPPPPPLLSSPRLASPLLSSPSLLSPPPLLCPAPPPRSSAGREGEGAAHRGGPPPRSNRP